MQNFPMLSTQLLSKRVAGDMDRLWFDDVQLLTDPGFRRQDKG